MNHQPPLNLNLGHSNSLKRKAPMNDVPITNLKQKIKTNQIQEEQGSIGFSSLPENNLGGSISEKLDEMSL